MLNSSVGDWHRWEINIPIKAGVFTFFIVLTPSLVIFTKADRRNH
jgi:hypothetical protein